MDSDLSLKIMYDLFKFIDEEDIDTSYKDAEVAIINLNSVFSTTFYEKMIHEFMSDDDTMEKYVESVGEMFKMVLTHLSSQRIILKYSDKICTFTELYPDWKKERYGNKDMNEFAKTIFSHFIDVFNQIENQNPTVDIINTDEFYPPLFTHAFIRLRQVKEPIFLISRDRLDFLNLINSNIVMYDGQEFYTEKSFKDHECKKLPNIDIHFLKYYYRLRGISKYDYPGVRGMGPKRTKDYLDKNMNDLVEGNHKHIDKEMMIFDFDMYIDYLKEKEEERYDKLIQIVNNTKF